MKKLMLCVIMLMLTACVSPEEESKAQVVSAKMCGDMNAVFTASWIGGLDNSLTVYCVNKTTGVTFKLYGKLDQ